MDEKEFSRELIEAIRPLRNREDYSGRPLDFKESGREVVNNYAERIQPGLRRTASKLRNLRFNG